MIHYCLTLYVTIDIIDGVPAIIPHGVGSRMAPTTLRSKECCIASIIHVPTSRRRNHSLQYGVASYHTQSAPPWQTRRTGLVVALDYLVVIEVRCCAERILGLFWRRLCWRFAPFRYDSSST